MLFHTSCSEVSLTHIPLEKVDPTIDVHALFQKENQENATKSCILPSSHQKLRGIQDRVLLFQFHQCNKGCYVQHQEATA